MLSVGYQPHVDFGDDEESDVCSSRAAAIVALVLEAQLGIVGEDDETLDADPAAFELTVRQRVTLALMIQRNVQEATTDPSRRARDCAIAATLDAIEAMPHGLTYLRTLVESFDEGRVAVRLMSRHGQSMTIVLPAHDTEHGSMILGDPTVLTIERALEVVNSAEGVPYAGVPDVAVPFAVMNQLGLESETLECSSSLGFEWMTGDSITVGRVSRASLAPYGLHAFHAYTVVGAFANPRTREPMLVLQNPWGSLQPTPIPASAVALLFPSDEEPATQRTGSDAFG